MKKINDLPGRGSPAHAGMVLTRRASSARLTWLPRTRGDGPGARTHDRRAHQAPPHTRGWSLTFDGDKLIVSGSPAHAGMVPQHVHPPSNMPGLPRTRGDGPCAWSPTRRGSSAPPHTRGWSLAKERRQREELGSPAHAGMVPRDAGAHGSLRWLPRTRGDGPFMGYRDHFLWKAPPHTRGWSPLGPLLGARSAGSPAHAGMVPALSFFPGATSWLPRTRGDGPLIPLARIGRAWAPPHTRGWSQAPAPHFHQFCGSPAHAGMVPMLAEAGIGCRGLPRTRGDGP